MFPCQGKSRGFESRWALMNTHSIIEHSTDTYYIDKCGEVELDYSLLVRFYPEQLVRMIQCRICGENVEIKIRPS